MNCVHYSYTGFSTNVNFPCVESICQDFEIGTLNDKRPGELSPGLLRGWLAD